MRSALFWDITQRWVVFMYRSFGTTYGSHLQGSRNVRKTSWPLNMEGLLPLKMEGLLTLGGGSDRFPKQNYHSALRNIAEGRVSCLEFINRFWNNSTKQFNDITYIIYVLFLGFFYFKNYVTFWCVSKTYNFKNPFNVLYFNYIFKVVKHFYIAMFLRYYSIQLHFSI
jgi:hypothetical protein